MKKRLIVAITGATGAVYGLGILKQLRELGGWESHLILSEAGVLNAYQELGLKRRDIEALADVVYNPRDIGATVASGSFLTQGMVIAPCSMKTLSAVANAYSDNLVARAADVILKERRRLVLITREAPLNLAHLRVPMQTAHQAGEFAKAAFRVDPASGQDFAFEHDLGVSDTRHVDGFAGDQINGRATDATGDTHFIDAQGRAKARTHDLEGMGADRN